MFTKHLCEKDEYANNELDRNFIDYSSYSDNQLISNLHTSSSDATSNACNFAEDKVKKKQRVNPGSTSVSIFNSRRIKSKQHYLSWFILYVEYPNTEDINWLKDFR